MAPTPDSIEYIDVSFEVKQIDDMDDEFFRFEGLASTFGNIDLVNDIVVRGAFTESLATKTPVILWQHQSGSPLGMPEEIRETEEGLFIKAKLPKADTFVSGRVIPQIKVGSIRTMSIGFRVIERDFNEEGNRLLKKVQLLEVSLVTFAANPLAKVSGFKNLALIKDLAPRNTNWISSEACERVRKETGSTEKPSESYREAFLWFDSKDTDNFDAYKLPFVDVIDGTLTAIPRAINSAKALLDQTDIPDADKTRVLANIDRYQAKLDEDQPKQFYNVESVKGFAKRDLEKALRESGAFSKDAALLIVKDFVEQGEPADGKDDVKSIVASLLDKLNSHSKATALSIITRKVNSYGN
ncbi:MAG: HK97 family phage prohead protease [Nitrosomonadaceae bacterium]